MAQNTWRALFENMTFSITGTSAPSLACLLNGSATRLLKVRRLGFINARTTSVSGVMCKGEIRRYTGASFTPGSSVTPVAYDSTSSALDSVTCGYNATPSGTPTVLSSYIWSSDEPAIAGATIDMIETFTSLGIQLDYGYGDSEVQSIALRQNEMLLVFNTAGAAGTVDIWIEFTDEAA